jgi:hypothetical protein
MVRFRHTLTLTAAAVAFTATGALASGTEPAPVVAHDQPMMATMHAQMHDRMDGHGDHHAGMAGDPAMREHMASYGVDHDEVAAWIAEGLSLEDMHARLAERGVDVEEMWRTCPMTSSMDGPMHGVMSGMQTMAPASSHADHHGDRAAPTR